MTSLYRTSSDYWESGEPNNYEHTNCGDDDCYENCAELRYNYYLSGFNDILCTLEKPFLCNTKREYIAVNEELDHESAENRCKELYGTHLATITSQSENNDAVKYIRKYLYIIWMYL